MSKVLAVMIAGLFAAGAYRPDADPPKSTPQASGKAAERAEAKKAAKPAGQVKAAWRRQAKAAEGSGGVTDKADKAGEARRDTRDDSPPRQGRQQEAGAPRKAARPSKPVGCLRRKRSPERFFCVRAAAGRKRPGRCAMPANRGHFLFAMPPRFLESRPMFAASLRPCLRCQLHC